MLGRRDFSAAVIDPVLAGIMARRPLFASLLRYLTRRRLAGSRGGRSAATRAQPWPGDRQSRRCSPRSTPRRATAAEVCEALVDIDEGVQEWRYRHVKMVERIIGLKTGTGGSAGSAYLRSTLFRSAFPDLWEIRSRP